MKSLHLWGACLTDDSSSIAGTQTQLIGVASLKSISSSTKHFIIQDIAPRPASFPTPAKEPNILSGMFHLGDLEAHWDFLVLVMRRVPMFNCIESPN